MSERRWGGSRADAPFRILYDGWPLAYEPSSPAALHLLALFAHLPAEVEGTVALPAPSPHILPARLEQARRPAANTPAARLNWEQRTLTALANEAGAVLIHLVGANPPLSGSLPVVESPASVPAPRTRPLTISERLRESLSVGAAAGVSAALWPADLSHPGGPVPAIPLPPVVHPAFTTPAPLRADLPPGYILYHGPLDERSLLEILEGWTWAGPAVGGEYPLLFAGLSEKEEHA
ncbi:MAG TPA: hypothetical protein VF813_03810, partial [Anaerolineaceae bacterium]